MVGNRQTVHAELLRPVNHLFYLAGAIQQTVLCMHM